MTLAIEFKSIAKRLQPDNDSLQDLDDAINDKDQIYDVMSGKSDFVCGMATVILSIMRLNPAPPVSEFPEDFKAQFLGFGKRGGIAVDRGNTALVFMNKDELVKGVGLGVIEGDELTFECGDFNVPGQIIVWWEDGHQLDSGESAEGVHGEMLSMNKKLVYFHELKKN